MKSTTTNLVRLLSELMLLFFSYLLLLSPGSALMYKTSSTDVKVLELLESSFPQLVTKGSDPCLTPLLWIQCSSDDTPRITALYLSNKNLAGYLPDFSAMDALETIDLSYNPYLGGEFPDFLAYLPKLKVLNLTYTNFRGTIPMSLYEKYENGRVIFPLTSWSPLCFSEAATCLPETPPIATWPTTGTVPPGIQTSPSTNWGRTTSNPRPPPTKTSKNRLPIGLGAGIPTFLIILLLIGLVVNSQKKDDTPGPDKSGEESSAEML